MRAVVCNAWGPPEALAGEDVPVPVPGAGDVLIRVRACGVNFADALIVYKAQKAATFGNGLDVYTFDAAALQLPNTAEP